MSELMDEGIIRMPYEMAMSDELSRKQFYSRANSLLTELTEIRAKLAAMETKCKELRAYQDASEDQLPLRYFVNEHLFKTLQEAVTFSEAARSMHGGMYRVVPMYARPVPPAYKAIYRTGLPSSSSRAHLLNEAASRADYFFRQVDGSYSFPAPDGQVSQIIEMLLAAANMPKGKTAVAVPENAGIIPMLNGKPQITNRMKAECIGEFEFTINETEEDYRLSVSVPWDVCKAIYKRMASVAMLEAAPSHSQSSIYQ